MAADDATPPTETREAKHARQSRLVRRSAAIGCTDADIAMLCECAESTLRKNFRRDLDQGRASLRRSVRLMQLRAARKGSAAMLIWLGKQILGQVDRQEITQHGGVLRIVERIVADRAGPGTCDDQPDPPSA